LKRCDARELFVLAATDDVYIVLSANFFTKIFSHGSGVGLEPSEDLVGYPVS